LVHEAVVHREVGTGLGEADWCGSPVSLGGSGTVVFYKLTEEVFFGKTFTEDERLVPRKLGLHFIRKWRKSHKKAEEAHGEVCRAAEKKSSRSEHLHD